MIEPSFGVFVCCVLSPLINIPIFVEVFEYSIENASLDIDPQEKRRHQQLVTKVWLPIPSSSSSSLMINTLCVDT